MEEFSLAKECQEKTGELDSAQWVKLEEALEKLREGGIAWQLVRRLIEGNKTSLKNKGQDKKMKKSFIVRTMTIEDYEGLYGLWMTIRGFGIRSIDDSKVGVERFLKRNPNSSVVAVDEEGAIVGGILCGHDGRRGCLYHVCVREDCRRNGIGKAMVVHCMNALKSEGINKVSLIAFTKNDVGNAFWNQVGWTKREDLNYYDFTLNEANITEFNK